MNLVQTLQAEINDLKIAKTQLLDEIQRVNEDRLSLTADRSRIEDDIRVLKAEASRMEEKIINLDTDYKAREERLGKQLADVQKQLKDTLRSLHAAQREDKQIRQTWAEEHLKLDKRKRELNKLATQVSNDEKQVESIDRFLKL